MYRFTLETGSKKFNCLRCGQKRYVRFVDRETGDYLPFEVGRCDRETSCGYIYTPKEFFSDNKNEDTFKRSYTNKNGFKINYEARISQEKPDYIPFEAFQATIGNYDENAFVQFLLNLFPDCAEEIEKVLAMYLVGTYEDYTCFPSIDRQNRICRAKLIRFDQSTGRRLKGEFDTSSLPAKLKLKENFNYKQTFFGEHLLLKFPDKPAAVVESEKSAIIASLCFPEFLWLGCNSKSWLKAERLRWLGNRQIILYPDADGFNLWQEIAQEAQKQGLKVKVSSLIETQATAEQKANGYDLADYLISQQLEINQENEFIDSYNSKLDSVLNDEFFLEDFHSILDEQKAISVINGGLSETEAETVLRQPENLRNAAWSV